MATACTGKIAGSINPPPPICSFSTKIMIEKGCFVQCVKKKMYYFVMIIYSANAFKFVIVVKCTRKALGKAHFPTRAKYFEFLYDLELICILVPDTYSNASPLLSITDPLLSGDPCVPSTILSIRARLWNACPKEVCLP